jgi:hypothetical protein
MPATMAKKKPKREQAPADPPKQSYPSRKNTRYVALPRKLHEALTDYARKHSDEDDTKSISWAARKAVRKFLIEEGYSPEDLISPASEDEAEAE